MSDTPHPLNAGPSTRATSQRSLPPCSARALALWPGLDRRRLARTHGDPARIARLVTRRTMLSADDVVAMVTKAEGHAP